MKPILQELKPTLRLAFPMILGLLGHMAMGIIDTMMIGRVGVVPVAGASFALSVFNPVLVVGFGFMSALSVLIARAFSEKDAAATARLILVALTCVWIYTLSGVAVGILTTPLLFIWGKRRSS